MSNKREIIWLDGSRNFDMPVGKLLSDNIGYWGECILTGMDYKYNCELKGPGETINDKRNMCGKRLIDGYINSNFAHAVEISGNTAVVDFDFKRRCFFSEFDVVSNNKYIDITLSVSTDGSSFDEVFFKKSSDSDTILHRCKLTDLSAVRYLRLKVSALTDLVLNEIYCWGEIDPTENIIEAFNPVVPVTVANSVAIQSINGIDRTAFADVQSFMWKRELDRNGIGVKSGVFATMNTWGELTTHPILPSSSEVNKKIELTMFRNEIECVCVSLTNTDIINENVYNVELKSNFEARETLSSKLYVMGAIPSKWYGINMGPMFSEDNMIGKSLMKKYLTNGEYICDFPKVRIQPAGSCIFWLKFETKFVEAGNYSYTLEGSDANIEIVINVLDIVLPTPRIWKDVCTYYTDMIPFKFADRVSKEVEYTNELGITTHRGWPVEGSHSQEAIRTNPNAQCVIWGMGKYVNMLYCGQLKEEDVNDEVRDDLVELMKENCDMANSFGLSFDQWYIETADEPNVKNAITMGKLVKICKEANNDIRTYVNPAYWTGWENGATSCDDDLYRTLNGWYEKYVDISCPLLLNLIDRPKSYELFSAKRETNAFYTINGQHSKSERHEFVNANRDLAWQAMIRGFNGYCYYAYFRPEGNPWDDNDEMIWEGLPDYQIVYPGINAPIPTRASEACREGWEDYRIMFLLKDTNPDAHERILNEFRNGNSNFIKLREMMIEGLTK